jgi:tetratricopeptide (TPR) repeat protein
LGGLVALFQKFLGPLLIGLGVAASASGAPVTESWQDWVRAGNQAYRKHALADAAQDYFQAARLEPSNALLLYDVGACEYLLGRSATAKAWGELSLARNPDPKATAQLLALVGDPPELVEGQKALRDKRWDVARAQMLVAVAKAPRDGLAWRGLALACARLGQAHAADQSLDQATALEPRCYDLPGVRQVVLEAVEDYLRIRDPAAYHTRRGVRLFREGDLAGARRDFEAVTALSPGDAQAWYHLAVACWKLQDGPATKVALERCLALDPGLVGALLLRAAYLRRAGQDEAARKDLVRLVTLGNANGYGPLAYQALSQLQTSAQSGGWHAYLRLLGGPTLSTTNNGVSSTTAASWNSQDYLRLDYDFVVGGHLLSAAYAAYLTPSQPAGEPWGWGDPYQSAELTQGFGLAGPWRGLADLTGSLRQDPGGGWPNYLCWAPKLELDGNVLGLKPLTLAVQGVFESFPDYTPYDSHSLVVSLGGTWSDARGDQLILTMAGRNNNAASTDWTYVNGSLTLYGRAALWGGLYLSVTTIATPQRYPSVSDGAGGTREDFIGFADPELGLSLPWGYAVFCGWQGNLTRSNLPLYSSSSGLAYAGLSWSH